MILRQYLHKDPVAASYLFGCGGKAAGAVVDPVGHVEFYLEAATETGLKLRYVIDTHLHADHVSTGRALAEVVGAEYVLFADADASYSFRGVRDGEVVDLPVCEILRIGAELSGMCEASTRFRVITKPRRFTAPPVSGKMTGRAMGGNAANAALMRLGL